MSVICVAFLVHMNEASSEFRAASISSSRGRVSDFMLICLEEEEAAALPRPRLESRESAKLGSPRWLSRYSIRALGLASLESKK